MKVQRFSYFLGMTGLAVFCVGGVLADGYRNPPPTAAGIAKSGVNSSFVDDASAISYNPANLAMQTNASFVASLTLARTQNSYHPAPIFNFESDGNWNALPNIYFSQPIGDSGVTWGVGVMSPYGQGISWNQSDMSVLIAGPAPVPYEASVMLVEINPTIAFSVADNLYLGVGADLIYSELELNALFPTGLAIPPYLDASGDGDGWGFGGNLGLTWLPSENQRVTLTYRSQVDVDYEGDFSLGGNFETSITYPNSFGFGYGVELTDNFRVEALVEWLEWSVNDIQTLSIGGVPNPQSNNWEDTFTFGVGADLQVDEHWVIRGGYAFIESPIPDSTLNYLLPDADRHAVSFGAGYSTGGHSIDLAYTMSLYADRNNTATGSYDIDSDLLGMTYSFSF
ncbi:MAG: outer membrane protein transport protein [Pontiellaceae bacterium]|nr:outer membrane protein transport protein [Pontiellaceae bacterium]MBN2785466.1 outer membrane protein transport protein [Pontiellaceae bacterium]